MVDDGLLHCFVLIRVVPVEASGLEDRPQIGRLDVVLPCKGDQVGLGLPGSRLIDAGADTFPNETSVSFPTLAK
jgi:hypothetical protein